LILKRKRLERSPLALPASSLKEYKAFHSILFSTSTANTDVDTQNNNNNIRKGNTLKAKPAITGNSKEGVESRKLLLVNMPIV